jgi:hypothetical protein
LAAVRFGLLEGVGLLDRPGLLELDLSGDTGLPEEDVVLGSGPAELGVGPLALLDTVEADGWLVEV